MKSLLTLVLVLLISFGVKSQEKNGAVYIKHPAIDNTKKFLAAFEKGDKEALGAFLADSMVAIYNGSGEPQNREFYLKTLDWWSTEFENLKVVDDAPAFPDAIEYSKGGVWVQDWLLITGTHKKSGINLKLHMHDLYQLNKAGKIASLHFYFSNEQFDAIKSSGMTQENGMIYINHPLITTVRKLVNAYCSMNIASTSEFFTEDARFSNSMMKSGESIDLAARSKIWEGDFAKCDNINLKQSGYPDCMYFSKEDEYVVNSWWVYSAKSKLTGKKLEFPLMMSHTFNKEGKIVREDAYFSNNHLE